MEDRARLEVPFLEQTGEKNKLACLYASTGMVLGYDGLPLTMDELRDIYPTDHSKVPTWPHELAKLINGVNERHGTNYLATFFLNTHRLFAPEDDKEAILSFMDFKKVEDFGHAVEFYVPSLKRNGGVKHGAKRSIQDMVELDRRPVIVGNNGHAAVVTGYREDGVPLIHDPRVGPYMPGGTEAHNRPLDQAILIRNVDTPAAPRRADASKVWEIQELGDFS